MAGTIATTTSDAGSSLTQYALAWVSDGAGAVSAVTVPVRAGHLRSLKVVPSGGATAPDALYDLTLLDSDGLDLLSALAGNLSATAPSLFMFNPPIPFPGGNIRPTIANAGAANEGTLYLIAG